MQPTKLQRGDIVRIISPSFSLATQSTSIIKIAEQRLVDMGLRVTYSKNCFECDEFRSSSIKSRIQDLEQAFLDKNVKMILCAIGGYNANQLLDKIDYSIIKNNPKIFCGNSDITCLNNAIYKKTNLITYCGPNFIYFGMQQGFEYTQEYFEKMFFNTKDITYQPSPTWSSDNWKKDQKNRTFINNEGPWIINQGQSEGFILGGNQCTFNLLQGTSYMPSLKGSILFLEDDVLSSESFVGEFDRNLESLIQCDGFGGVMGLVIGRCEKISGMTCQKLEKIIKNKPVLNSIPVVANVDFGHTTPMITFGIGGKVHLVSGDTFDLRL